MALQDIEKFLAQEGRFESRGHFTLDEKASLDKLAEFQAERPGLWLVKLLQAAVASGAPEFRVRQFVHDTRVTFEPKLPLDWDSWRQGQSCKRAGARHLQLALQAASTLPGARVSLGVAGQSWTVERGALRLPWETVAAGQIEVVRRWEFPLSLLVPIRRSRLLVDEALLLQELGRYAPLPIRLDGRLLNDPVINKPPGLRLGVYVPPLLVRPWPAIPYTAMERLVVSDEYPGACFGLMDHTTRIPNTLDLNGKSDRTRGRHCFLQQWQGPQWLSRDDWKTTLRARSPGFQFNSRIERNDGLFEIWSDYNRGLRSILVKGYLSLDINRGRAGRMYLIKDGLLMKPKMLDEELREVLILWSAPEVRTDLSQLQVVEDEVYQVVWRTVRQHLLAAAESLNQTLKLRGLDSALQAEHRERAQRVAQYLNTLR